jgi:hypothetical protein
MSVVTTRVLLAGIVVPLRVVVELELREVNAPELALEAPTLAPLIVPPVMAALAFSVLSLFRFVKLLSTSVWVRGEPLPALVTIVDIIYL